MNALRTSPDALRARLERGGFVVEDVPGMPGFLRLVRAPYPVSRTLEHWLGLFYLQQAATGIAALALGAEPGERVLDLCAAPGGKASHLAERMGGEGVLVAGDNNAGRLRALLGNVYRLGHDNVLAVSADGRTFPLGARFDRVLLDVPCTGEGNPRRRRGGRVHAATPASFRDHIRGVQRALLRRAVDLVRPGGTILYVTCTSAVEENEAVVARALARHPLSLEPIPLDLPHDPGLAGHAGRSYPPQLELAWRIRPEHLGSGTLFLARLRREPGDGRSGGGHPADRSAGEASEPAEQVAGPGDGWSPVPHAYTAGGAPEVTQESAQDALAELRDEMELEDGALAGARWMTRGDSLWLHRCAEWPLEAWGRGAGANAEAEWRFVSLGLRAFKKESSGRLRPTNDLLRRLNGAIRRRVVDLTPQGALRLLEGASVPTDGLADGYAALRLDGHVIGRGFVRAGLVRSEIPRPLAATLADALARATE